MAGAGDLDAVRRHGDHMVVELARSLGRSAAGAAPGVPLDSFNEAVPVIRRSTDGAQDQRRAELATGVTGLTPAALMAGQPTERDRRSRWPASAPETDTRTTLSGASLSMSVAM